MKKRTPNKAAVVFDGLFSQRRTGRWFFTATVLLSLNGAAGNGCRPPAIPVSGHQRVHPSLRAHSLADLTKLFNRKIRKEKILLSVTLWDRSFVEAFLRRRAQKKSWSDPQLKRAIAQWSKRFLKNQTAFRVRLEALDRPLTVEGRDLLLNLNAWRWELWDSNGKRIEASTIQLESKRVFKDKTGNYSFRVDGNIHFKYALDPKKTRWIEVLAIPPGDMGTLHLPRWRIKS